MTFEQNVAIVVLKFLLLLSLSLLVMAIVLSIHSMFILHSVFCRSVWLVIGPQRMFGLLFLVS